MRQWTRYTKEQEQFLIDNASEMDLYELANAFNVRFGTEFTKEQLYKKATYLGVKPKKYVYDTQFTKEMDEFLLENAYNYSYPKLREMLHERFDILIPVPTITEHCRKRLGITDKPKKTCSYGYHGVPIGTERIDKNRTIMVKVAYPNVWKPKTYVILGDIPKGKQVIFLDGDSLNVTKENIIVVDKKIHARLAKNGWLNSDKDVILTGVDWSKLLYAIKDLKQEDEGND